MLHRVKAYMRFPASSGMATWARDNMSVRYQQAIHIRQGEDAEEVPVNEVQTDGDREIFVCDLPLMNAEHAQDAVNTLAGVFAFSEPEDDGEGGTTPAWAEYHMCDHDEDNRSGCILVDRQEA